MLIVSLGTPRPFRGKLAFVHSENSRGVLNAYSLDRSYFTGDRVQRKLKWALGTRSPFTEDSITGLCTWWPCTEKVKACISTW